MATYQSTGGRVASGPRINRTVGFVFGTVFVLVGLTGFLVSGGHHPAGAEGGLLLGLFRVNLLHNAVHLLVGAVMIAAAVSGDRAAARANAAFGAIYLVLFFAGLVAIGTGANIIALNGADNGLHLVLGLALLAAALLGDRPRRGTAI
jgi:hypothetical protein